MGTVRDLPNLRADARSILSIFAYSGLVVPAMEPEHRLVPRLVSSGCNVLDIGANVGLYSLQLARLVGSSGRVIAFEPYPPSARRLRTLARRLKLDWLQVEECALTDSKSSREFVSSAPPAAGGAQDALVHLVPETEAGRIPVRAATVDNEVDRLGLGRVSLIKCDVEGAEWKVFEGAKRTLARDRPAVICEIEDRWARRYGHGREEVISFIGGLLGAVPMVYERGTLRLHSVDDREHPNVVFYPTRS